MRPIYEGSQNEVRCVILPFHCTPVSCSMPSYRIYRTSLLLSFLPSFVRCSLAQYAQLYNFPTRYHSRPFHLSSSKEKKRNSASIPKTPCMHLLVVEAIPLISSYLVLKQF